MRNIFNSFKKTSVAERGSDESVRNLIDWRDRNEPELTGDNASIAFVTHTGRKLTVPEVSEVLLKHIRAEAFINKSNGKRQTRYISFVNGSTDFDKERLPGSKKLLQASDIKRGTVLGIHATKEEAIQTFLNHLRTGNRMGGQDEISAPVRADVTPSEARARALGQDIADMDSYYCTSSGLARLNERLEYVAKDLDYAPRNNLSVVKNRLSEASANAVVIDRHNGIGKNGKPQPGFPMGTETVRGGHIITVQKHDDSGGEERLYVLSHHSDEYEKAYPGVKFLRLAQKSKRDTSPDSTFPSDNAKKFPIEPVQFDKESGGEYYQRAATLDETMQANAARIDLHEAMQAHAARINLGDYVYARRGGATHDETMQAHAAGIDLLGYGYARYGGATHDETMQAHAAGADLRDYGYARRGGGTHDEAMQAHAAGADLRDYGYARIGGAHHDEVMQAHAAGAAGADLRVNGGYARAGAVSPVADYTIDPYQILGRGVGTQIDLGPYTGTITDIEMPTKIFKRT